MGESVSWVAVRGKPPARILRELGLRPSGAREPSLFYLGSDEAPFAAAALSDGWYVVVANGTDYFSAKVVMKALSQGCMAVSCFLESHVMVSTASCWTDGKPTWSVTHDTLNKGKNHLATSGSVPAAFVSILKQQRAKPTHPGPPWPADVSVDHLFDIPMILAESFTGFRHDGPAARREFEILAGSTTVRAG
jgi:hypothetical protein